MAAKHEHERLDLDALSERATEHLEQIGLLEMPIDGRVARAADPRTVRYYQSLGLVDRPIDHEGGRARYGERHVLQLVAIKALQRHHRPLADIQAQLYGRTDDELRSLIATLGVPHPRAHAHDVRVVRTNEAMLAPGLKLVAEDGLLGAMDEERLVERFRAALVALRASHKHGGAAAGDL